MRYLVWRPDAGETVEHAVTVEADFADEAAAHEAERRDRIAAEWPERSTLHVQAPDGRVFAVEVRCVPEPTYYAGRPRLA